MRVPAIAIVVCAASGAAPLQAQSDEEVVLADPAFSLTFSAGYIASDLGLWQKHGIKVKTVAITGIGAINAVISGSRAVRPGLGELVRPRQRPRPEADRHRHHHRPAVRPDRAAQGHRGDRRLRCQGAAGEARRAAQGPHHRGRFHQFDDPRLCAAGRGALRLQPRRHPRRADGAGQHARGVPEQADRRLRHVAAVAAKGGAGRRSGGDCQRPGRRTGRHDPVRPQPDRDQAGDLREAQSALHGDGTVDQGC